MAEKIVKGDLVEHIEDAPGFPVKVLEVMPWGQVIVEWPNGQLWIEDSKFLKLHEPEKEEEC